MADPILFGHSSGAVISSTCRGAIGQRGMMEDGNLAAIDASLDPSGIYVFFRLADGARSRPSASRALGLLDNVLEALLEPV